MVQNIFWKSETAIERILLVLAAGLLWKPGFMWFLLIFYVLFEGMLLFGRFIEKKGIIIGAQVVITGVLLLFFHEIPVIYPPEDGEEVTYFSAIGVIAALSLILYVALILLSKAPLVMGAIIIAADIYVVTGCINGYEPDKVVVAALVALTLLELSRAIAFISEKIKKKSSYRRLANASKKSLDYRWLVFFILLEVLVFAVPVNEKPIDWSVLYKIGYRVRDGFERLAENTGYYLSGLGGGLNYQSGYSSFLSVPDEVSGKSRDELYITTVGTVNNLYLAGHIDGPDSDIAKEMEGEKLLDFLYALHSHEVGRDEARCFGNVMKLRVELGYLRTKDIIRPENTILIKYGEKDELTQAGTGFKKIHKKGDSYETVYMNVDYGSRYLEDVMRNPVYGAVPSYAEMEEYCAKLYDYQLGRSVTEKTYDSWSKKKSDSAGYFSKGEYRAWKDKAFSEYLDAGEYETDRLKELALDITKNAQNDYDACRLIEKYLRQYKYSIHPAKGDGKSTASGSSDNYIETFLFETGEGYCVHFASSMIELLKLSGIPARYVQGYCYKFPSKQNDRFTINGDKAHVWVEAYIEGMGWVPFEPTAGRRTSIDSTWNYTIPEEEVLSDTAIDELPGEGYVPSIPENATLGIDEQIMEEPTKKTIDMAVVGKTIGTIIIGLLIYSIFMWGMVIFVRFLRYKRAPLSERLNKNVKDICRIFDKDFVPSDRKVNVLEDYVGLISEDENVAGDRPEIISLKELSAQIFGVYYRQRFAGKAATGEEVADSEYLRAYLAKRHFEKMLRRRK